MSKITYCEVLKEALISSTLDIRFLLLFQQPTICHKSKEQTGHVIHIPIKYSSIQKFNTPLSSCLQAGFNL